MFVECVPEHGGGVGAVETRQCVAAPAVEVGGVEREVGAVVEPAGRVRQQGVGGVEGAQAGVGLIGGGERFAVGSGEPGPQQPRRAGGQSAGLVAELGGVVAAVDVGEHDGLLGEGVGE